MPIPLTSRPSTLIVSLLSLIVLVAAGCSSAAQPPAQATAAGGEIRIRDAWARSTAGNPDENSAVYLVVENPGGADRLVGASVAGGLARTVELHVTEEVNGQMQMRPVPGWDVPPKNGKLELKPAGNHVMLIGLTKPLKVGDSVSLTLRFEQAGEIRVDAPVREAQGAMGMKGN